MRNSVSKFEAYFILWMILEKISFINELSEDKLITVCYIVAVGLNQILSGLSFVQFINMLSMYLERSFVEFLQGNFGIQ